MATINSTTTVGDLTVSGQLNVGGKIILQQGNQLIRKNMNDLRGCTTSWADCANRVLRHTKKSDSSNILITIADTFGSSQNGTSSTALQMRILVDGSENPSGRQKWNHNSNASGGWFIISASYRWLLTGISAGAHTYQLQWTRGGGAGDCLTGWSGGDNAGQSYQENFMLIEELF